MIKQTNRITHLIDDGTDGLDSPAASPPNRIETATGLYAHRYRDFCPEIGHWIATEPVGYIEDSTPYPYAQPTPGGGQDAT